MEESSRVRESQARGQGVGSGPHRGRGKHIIVNINYCELIDSIACLLLWSSWYYPSCSKTSWIVEALEIHVDNYNRPGHTKTQSTRLNREYSSTQVYTIQRIGKKTILSYSITYYNLWHACGTVPSTSNPLPSPRLTSLCWNSATTRSFRRWQHPVHAWIGGIWSWTEKGGEGVGRGYGAGNHSAPQLWIERAFLGQDRECISRATPGHRKDKRVALEDPHTTTTQQEQHTNPLQMLFEESQETPQEGARNEQTIGETIQEANA
mgnify:CR=1 FL=1